jgi:hypothetical protein
VVLALFVRVVVVLAAPAVAVAVAAGSAAVDGTGLLDECSRSSGLRCCSSLKL